MKKIQHKIVAFPLLIMLFVSLASMLIIGTYVEERMLARMEIELEQLAAVSLEAIRSVDILESSESSYHNHTEEKALDHLMRSFHIMAKSFGKAAEVRITFIDDSGKVLGDSNSRFEELDHIEGYNDLLEISKNLQKTSNQKDNINKFYKNNTLYIALQSHEDGHLDKISHINYPITIHAARPLSTTQYVIHEMRTTLLFMGLISLLIVVVLGALSSRLLSNAVLREQGKLEHRVAIRTNAISILQTQGSLLNSCSTFAEAAHVISMVLPSLLPGIKGSIAIMKSSRNHLKVIAQWGGEWPGTEKFSHSDCWALRKGHQHASSSQGLNIYCTHWKQLNQNEQTLCIPLLAQGETIGVLSFVADQYKDLTGYNNILEAVTEQIGLTLANIQLRENLHEQAIRDPLTNLYNRRYMQESIGHFQGRVDRQKETMTILMIDLDHFKRFNDDFGHDAGDYVLKSVANVLKECARLDDIVCRFGGEEFCIVCPHTEEASALMIAERIRKNINLLDLKIRNIPLGKVTASIGIAIYPTHGSTINDTIIKADEALYKAKEEGRDRVIISTLVTNANGKQQNPDQ